MRQNRDQSHSGRYHRFWILGGGRFGQLAVQRIRHHMPGAEVTVIDEKPTELNADRLICADGIAWLAQHLEEYSPVDMVVPAIPVHVAAGWLQDRLSAQFTIHAIDPDADWINLLPNAIRGQSGQYFVSHADFICPDNCPEPEKICTYTKKTRPLDLFRLLALMPSHNLTPIVLRSHQLLPGVGGLLPAELFSALAKATTHSDQPLMVATACRCHGVVNLFKLFKKGLQLI
ncbi:MAG: potassium transporter [Pseudomonadota bacterium]